jgi:hypothetical protein
MDVIENTTPHKSGWFVWTIVSSLIGAFVATAFVIWWFPAVAQSCGVVRFYEQLFGVILICGWVIGIIIGIFGVGVSQNASIKRLFNILIISTNIALVSVAASVVYNDLSANLTLKSDNQLILLLSNGDLDDKKIAAFKLGERRVVDAIPHLLDLLTNPQTDINLRHNAAISLGEICAPPRKSGTDVDNVVAALIVTLKDPDEYLPSSASEALGKIRDPRAIVPLAELICDTVRSEDSRAGAVLALGEIGGKEAVEALLKSREKCNNDYLRTTIDRVIKLTNP